ncbi:MAG TPA: hypothetical protein VJ717_08950 [Gemmatimonadaceae bacterium]|nr:hypothetical protein [Gemmatimonadaceae bacterium]
MSRVAARCVALLIMAGAFAPNESYAQVISPRTVPVLIGQQFDILPSHRAGMAGVSIALDDTLIDPFVNPAKAARIRSALFSVAPFFYRTTASDGGGRTFPVSGIGPLGRSSWSGGGLFALQQIDRANLSFNQTLSERTASNQYLMGVLAKSFGSLSVGASAYHADLAAEEGIDLLYSGSDRIQQAGHASDMRIGVVKDWAEKHRSFEVMILRSQFDMTHDVHYPALIEFRPPNQQIPIPERQEHNRDHTRMWGAHTEYSQAVGTNGWRIGWLATANRLSHPKIPDYRIREVITVPRDPGRTWAYNLGFGLGRSYGLSTFGFDVVIEPMFSTTWAEALGDTVSRTGTSIPRGGHTVDNRNRFSNAMLAFGFGHETPLNADSTERFGFQVGLGVKSIRYRLKQWDRIQETSRVQDEQWMEWSPTLGFKLRGRGFDAGYTFTLTCGAGTSCLPCICGGDDVSVTEPPVPGGGGVIASPTDALRFDGGRVTTHRFTITMRIR